MSQVRRSAPWMAGLLVVLAAGPAQPQGSLDAGRTPAQMFADVCTNCHRRPQELKRGASVGFLRQHYMPGSQEAAAMAAYLASLPNDPRGRGKDRDKDKDRAAKAPPQQANDKSKSQPTPKGRRPAELAKGPSEPPPESPPEPAETPAALPTAQPEPDAPSAPKLEPFEE